MTDERAAAIFLDWWMNHPVDGDHDEMADDALDDFRSLVAALAEHGYAIVRVPSVSDEGEPE